MRKEKGEMLENNHSVTAASNSKVHLPTDMRAAKRLCRYNPDLKVGEILSCNLDR